MEWMLAPNGKSRMEQPSRRGFRKRLRKNAHHRCVGLMVHPVLMIIVLQKSNSALTMSFGWHYGIRCAFLSARFDLHPYLSLVSYAGINKVSDVLYCVTILLVVVLFVVWLAGIGEAAACLWPRGLWIVIYGGIFGRNFIHDFTTTMKRRPWQDRSEQLTARYQTITTVTFNRRPWYPVRLKSAMFSLAHHIIRWRGGVHLRPLWIVRNVDLFGLFVVGGNVLFATATTVFIIAK